MRISDWSSDLCSSDLLKNDITGGTTPASFEPSSDYVVTKIPRFTFEKFPQADSRLTTQMKSVGEVMAMGRNFQESLHKAMRGLEVGSDGFDPIIVRTGGVYSDEAMTRIRTELAIPRSQRLWYIGEAFRAGLSVADVFNLSKIDVWFLEQIEELILTEEEMAEQKISRIEADDIDRKSTRLNARQKCTTSRQDEA